MNILNPINGLAMSVLGKANFGKPLVEGFTFILAFAGVIF